MSLTDVQPWREDESVEAGRTLGLAFQEDPLFSFVLPDPQGRAQKLPPYLSILVRFGHLFGEAWTAGAAKEGIAVWQPPGSDVTPERAEAAGFGKLPEILGMEELQRLGSVLDHLQNNHRADVATAHWYLMIVGVTPERMRNGVGTALLRPGLESADKDGVPIYLDTAERSNIPFYEKLGFEVAVESVEPSSGLTMWTLSRPAPLR